MNKKNQSIDQFYTDISSTIDKCKHSVQSAVNDAMVMLYWTIGKYLVCNVLDNNKAEYGQKIVEELAQKLTLNYGKGFEKTSLFRMIQFYREFPDNQMGLSQKYGAALIILNLQANANLLKFKYEQRRKR